MEQRGRMQDFNCPSNSYGSCICGRMERRAEQREQRPQLLAAGRQNVPYQLRESRIRSFFPN